jgi:hypothetical protein
MLRAEALFINGKRPAVKRLGLSHSARLGSGTEEIFGKPVMMPSGDLYPSIDYWMPH